MVFNKIELLNLKDAKKVFSVPVVDYSEFDVTAKERTLYSSPFFYRDKREKLFGYLFTDKEKEIQDWIEDSDFSKKEREEIFLGVKYITEIPNDKIQKVLDIDPSSQLNTKKYGKMKIGDDNLIYILVEERIGLDDIYVHAGSRRVLGPNEPTETNFFESFSFGAGRVLGILHKRGYIYTHGFAHFPYHLLWKDNNYHDLKLVDLWHNEINIEKSKDLRENLLENLGELINGVTTSYKELKKAALEVYVKAFIKGYNEEFEEAKLDEYLTIGELINSKYFSRIISLRRDFPSYKEQKV